MLKDHEKKLEISIAVITYNHAKTVKKALDSVLSQNIAVPYEVLVIDDASDDGTKEIIAEYARKYHQIIPCIRKYNNCYPTKNFYYVIKEKARGRYLAFLEGDDCWIDTNKLSEQYKILEENRAFSAVTTDIRCEDECGEELSASSFYYKKENGLFSLDDYCELNNPGRLATLFFRNPYLEGYDCRLLYQADYIMGDMSLYAILLTMGDIYQLDKKTALYTYVTKKEGTNFNSLNTENRFLLLRQFRYWIRIENYIRENADLNFRIETINKVLPQISNQYKWRDIWIAIRESKDKARIFEAFCYHNFSINGRLYNKTEKVPDKGAKNWIEFMRDKRPVVLFGAGALAAEFLDNYSWQKKVRFIVDNDKQKIGKPYKGYLVKKPDEIMAFRGKIAVVIANEKYEKEISEQLKKMGVNDYYFYYSMQEKRIFNRLIKLIS